MTVKEDLAERDRLLEEQRCIMAELSPVLDRLRFAGEEDHMHGNGTHEDPTWFHCHRHDGRHEHSEDESIPERDAARYR